MLVDLLTLETIQVMQKAADWKEAIRIAAEPLLKEGFINQNYISAMITNVLEMGPYIVIAPRIALAHARPEDGVKQMGMSLLCLKESVPFSDHEKHDVHLIIVLAAADSTTHLQALAELANLLSEEDGIRSIIEADSPLSIFQIIHHQSTDKEV